MVAILSDYAVQASPQERGGLLKELERRDAAARAAAAIALAESKASLEQTEALIDTHTQTAQEEHIHLFSGMYRHADTDLPAHMAHCIP